jgi:hypothetical protein
MSFIGIFTVFRGIAGFQAFFIYCFQLIGMIFVPLGRFGFVSAAANDEE